jgi:hypothetical protein
MRQRDPAKAIAVLDLLTEFFGEVGHRWISGMSEDRYGGRCLVNAVHHVRTEGGIGGDDTEHYLLRRSPQTRRTSTPLTTTADPMMKSAP